MAERINSLDPEGLSLDGSMISRYERGIYNPPPHIQGAYQAVALVGGVAIPEQTGPRLLRDQIITMVEADMIIAYCTDVIDGRETEPPPVELARSILALARSSLAGAQRDGDR